MTDFVAAILWNMAHGFTAPGKLDWTDRLGRLHRVRCVHAGNTWVYTDRALAAQGGRSGRR